jgi:hypothetical protein
MHNFVGTAIAVLVVLFLLHLIASMLPSASGVVNLFRY